MFYTRTLVEVGAVGSYYLGLSSKLAWANGLSI